ncbi:MAG: EamA family transporter [Leptolyngbyaceae cyanobacterium MO_188.B28]|nr:EamA family transporter [Leptolyngbyaceae cyanobacterium MO_188.B28]
MSILKTTSKRDLSTLSETQRRQRRASKPQDLDHVGVLLVMLSALGFGTLAIFGKLAYAQGLDPLSALSWRLGGATVALWGWLLLRNQRQVPLSAAISALSLGAIGYALQSALFFNALSYASAGLTALMFYTYPAFVALISWGTTRQAPTSWQLKVLGLSLLGCWFTLDVSHEIVQPLGILLGISAGAGYALYMTLSSRLVRNVPPIQAAAFMLLGATATVGSITVVLQGVVIPTTTSGLSAVLGLAVISTALPIVFLFAGLRRLRVVPAAILSTLEPALAVVMGIWLLGEQLQLAQLLGGAMIISSALLLQVTSGRQKNESIRRFDGIPGQLP